MTKHLFLFLLALASVAFGEPPIPKDNRYEVVAIRPGLRGANTYGYHYSLGEIRLDNISLAELISAAFLMPKNRFIGLPAWASSERFSLRAKSLASASPRVQWAMWIPVLENRFGLKYHHRRQAAPVYALSALPVGVRFPVAVPGECTPIGPNDTPNAVIDPKKPNEPMPPNNCGVVLAKQLPRGGVELSVKGTTMAQLSGALQHYVDRPVIDRTGITQPFNVLLVFELGLDANATDTSSGIPTIHGALKRAGLKLTSAQDDVDVIIVDRLEKPSEN